MVEGTEALSSMAAKRHQKEPFAGLAKEADSAAQAVECFPDSFSCIVPSNNILYAFLVCVCLV